MIQALRRFIRGKREKRRNGDEGFTLVEILVVLTIVGILAASISPVIIRRIDDARQTKALMQIRTFEDALERYSIDVGDYPASTEGIEALMIAPDNVVGWTGPYVRGALAADGTVAPDPWGNPYVYINPGDHAELGYTFDLISYGKEGQEGGEGVDSDITNWAGVIDEAQQ